MNEKHLTPAEALATEHAAPSGGHGTSPSTPETRAFAARRHLHFTAGHARKSTRS